jgi:hypothetical protein
MDSKNSKNSRRHNRGIGLPTPNRRSTMAVFLGCFALTVGSGRFPMSSRMRSGFAELMYGDCRGTGALLYGYRGVNSAEKSTMFTFERRLRLCCFSCSNAQKCSFS